MCLSLSVSVCVSASVCLPVCLSVCQSVCTSVCLFVCLSFCLYVCHPPANSCTKGNGEPQYAVNHVNYIIWLSGGGGAGVAPACCTIVGGPQADRRADGWTD